MTMESYADRKLMEIAPPRREVARQFMNYIAAILPNPASQIGYAKALVWLEVTAGDSNYREMTKEDIMAWRRMMGEKLPKSASAYAIHVKRFFQWVYYGEDAEKGVYPGIVRWMHENKNRGQDDKPKHISQKQIQKLIECANNQRDRALIVVAYDCGARAGELLNLKISDVAFDKYGAKIRLSGKTGTREVRIFHSIPDLQLWLNQHPERENPDAPLWTGFRISRGHALQYAGYKHVIYKLRDKAGLPKWVHPHTLRHSRATHLAGKLTEPQMREYFGWTKSSDMPAIYVHLSGRDVDNALLKAHGIEIRSEDKGEEDILKPSTCVRGHDNPAGSKWCNHCGMPLDMETAMAVEKVEDTLTEKGDMIHEIKEIVYQEIIAKLKAGGEI